MKALLTEELQLGETWITKGWWVDENGLPYLCKQVFSARFPFTQTAKKIIVGLYPVEHERGKLVRIRKRPLFSWAKGPSDPAEALYSMSERSKVRGELSSNLAHRLKKFLPQMNTTYTFKVVARVVE